MRRTALALALAACGGKSDAPDVTLEVAGSAVHTHDGRFQISFPSAPTVTAKPDMQVAEAVAPDFGFKLIAVPVDYDASSDVPALYDAIRTRSWLMTGGAATVKRDDILLLFDQVARRLQIVSDKATIDEWLVYVPWERAVFAIVATHDGKSTERAEKLVGTLAITRPNRSGR